MVESVDNPRGAALGVRIILGLVSGAGMALAAWLLISPDVGPPPRIPFQDKIFHVIAFGCLTGPALLVLPRRVWPFWIAHMLALGAGIEVVQALDGKGRTGSLADFLADAVGVAIAVWVGRWLVTGIRGKGRPAQPALRPDPD